MNESNLSRRSGSWGLGAPGEGIVSLIPAGQPAPRAGTSYAAAFVSGTIALLWSMAPDADAGRVRHALGLGRRGTIIPPLLDAHTAYRHLTGRAA